MNVNFTRRQVGLAILGATTALTLGLPFPVQAATGKKIAILPKTFINDVFQIKVAESSEQGAKKLGIITERFALSDDVAVQG